MNSDQKIREAIDAFVEAQEALEKSQKALLATKNHLVQIFKSQGVENIIDRKTGLEWWVTGEGDIQSKEITAKVL